MYNVYLNMMVGQINFIQISYVVLLLYFKNFCYEECDGGYNIVRCFLYYMIIGMFKCGIISFYFDLIYYKDVVWVKRKEFMYFNRMCFCKCILKIVIKNNVLY